MLSAIRAALITDPLIILATVAYGSVSLITSLFDSTGRAQHRVACAWARVLLRIGRVTVRVEGLENIAPGGSYVFACNHLSYMDIPSVLPHIPVQFRFLAKKGLFKIPFLGYHLHRAGHIPVDRSSSHAALKTISYAANIVKEKGASLLFFPEGGRSPAEMRPFRDGAAYMAIKAGVPAVPIALIGTREILPMDSLLVKPGLVVLRIGQPIPTVGMKVQDRQALTTTLRERVVELVTEDVVRETGYA